MNSFKELEELFCGWFEDNKISKEDFNKKITLILLEEKNLLREGKKRERSETDSFRDKFYGEIRPLQKFLHDTQFTHITVNKEGAKFDAVVSGPQGEQNIECTQALDEEGGRQRAHSIEYMEENGFYISGGEANFYTTGNKNTKNRKVHQKEEPCAVEVTELKRDQKETLKELIHHAALNKIDNKNKKSGEGEKKAVLLISFHKVEYLVLEDFEIRAACEELIKTNPLKQEIFESIYVIALGKTVQEDLMHKIDPTKQPFKRNPTQAQT